MPKRETRPNPTQTTQSSKNSRTACFRAHDGESSPQAHVLLVRMAWVAAQPPSAGITICNRVGTTGYRARISGYLWNLRARAIRSRVKLQFTNCPLTIHVTGWRVGSQAPRCGLPGPLTWREEAEAQHREETHGGGDGVDCASSGTGHPTDWYVWHSGGIRRTPAGSRITRLLRIVQPQNSADRYCRTCP